MARKEKNIHYIYKTTCNVTGRWYIGMHSTNNLEDGYMGSGLRLRRSIRKYGVENHVREILEFFENRELLSKREQEIVTFELIKEDLCMNLVAGGNGGYISEDGVKKGRKKCNEILKEKYGDKYMQKMMLEYHNSLSDEKKIENKEKISKRLKEINFNNKTFEGKHHSEDSKQKMSESSKGMGVGNKNSQYGTCWITKNGVNKKIKKEILEEYLSQDWVQGRK